MVGLTGLASVRRARAARGHDRRSTPVPGLDWQPSVGAVVGSVEMAAQENATSNAVVAGPGRRARLLEPRSEIGKSPFY